MAKDNTKINFSSKEQAIEFLETLQNSKNAKIIRRDPAIARALRQSKEK